MNWGLTQGILGRAKHALAPSSVALGPNTYLAEKDFLKMLGIAFLVHAVAFGIYALLPSEKVTDIPVRALSFKLGGEDRVAAYAPVPAVAATAANVPAPVAPPVMQASGGDSWRATPNVPSPVVPAPLKPIARPVPKPILKAEPQPPRTEVKQPRIVKVEETLAQYQPPTQYPSFAPAAAPAVMPTPAPVAVAPQPQQYVREVGAPSPQVVAAVVKAATPDGSADGEGAISAAQQTAQAIKAKYEMEISSWIQRHKYYPPSAGGREGRAVVRVRIDRAGNVRYYAIEQSSGMVALDDTALDMIRRANPVPAVPDNYQAGNLIEFLIPITFKAPQ